MSKASQRYEIYVNEKPLFLISDEEFRNLESSSNSLIMPYSGSPKSLFQYLDILEKASRFDQVILYHKEPKQIFKELKKILNISEAAGGVIENDEGKILLIFRRSFWDLPKGKLDTSETFEHAAIRECQEETGLHKLVLLNKIGTTYHFFRDKKNDARSLKKTKWFLLKLEGQEELRPQAEEDIELAEWVDPAKSITLSPIYKNILIVLNQFINFKKNEDHSF